MRGLFLFVAASVGILMGGSAVGPGTDDPSLSYASLGRSAPFFYHHVEADCMWITHGFGRNDAWGLWRLPLRQVQAVASGERQIAFGCDDGSNCIEAGRLSTTPDRVSSHILTFEMAEGATDFLEQLDRLREACAVE